MIQFDYTSIDLFKNNKKYKLSSIIGEDNFFYGLFERDSGKLVCAKLINDLPLNYFLNESFIEELFRRENLFHPAILKIQLAFLSDHFSIIPQELYSNKKDLAKFLDSFTCLHNDNHYELVKNEIDYLASDFYYFIPIYMEAFLKKQYGETKIVHLNEALARYVRKINERFIFINLFNDKMQTIVMNNGALMQTNNYTIQGVDDVLYYVLLNAKNFNFNPEYDQFYLAGTLEKDSLLIQSLIKHIKHLDFLGNNDRLHFSNVFLAKSKHLFYDLDCVVSCE